MQLELNKQQIEDFVQIFMEDILYGNNVVDSKQKFNTIPLKNRLSWFLSLIESNSAIFSDYDLNDESLLNECKNIIKQL